jgi:threonyl-tRNA synthetase
MLKLRLPDGSIREVASGTTAWQVAESIGKRLAQAAVAAEYDGQVVDLNRELPPDGAETKPPASFRIFTEKDPEALGVLRHSCAHVMARAVMRLFPNVQLAFGPTIENGFYYDVDSEPPIREEDFPRIEEEMKKIVAQAEPFERFERPPAEARGLVEDLKQGYKVEHIDDELKQYPSLSFYRQGEFIDLCRGPHIPHAGRIGAFKVLNIAGAYWKNDASRKQLQRLYGTAFFSQKDLDAYLKQIEEAKKRDHRILGKQLKLFTISQMVGSGLILWMPKGATVRGILESFIKEELLKRGYQPVYTPHIGRLELYRTSGHFPYYRDAQYPPLFLHRLGQTVDTWLSLLESDELNTKTEQAFLDVLEQGGKDMEDAPGEPAATIQHYKAAAGDKAKKVEALKGWVNRQEGYLVKPMNCPHHINIYKAEPRSYRDLPVRLAEFGTVYRFEQTGELSGMTRVRGFTQDDAHLFCTEDQVGAEFGACIDFTRFFLNTLGLTKYRARLGFRDPASNKYVGSDEAWAKAEKSIQQVALSMGLPDMHIEPGEAAFYGPKVDFIVNDCIGREWQLGTVQLDYNLPERFGLEYIGADNAAHRPVMIHRAPLGSMERFMGILIEHFAGAFPLWLAPEQARVMTVSDKFNDYAAKVAAELKGRGLRVAADLRPEKIGYKIREAQLEKIPYMLVVGDKEQQAGTVAVRERSQGDQGAMAVAEVIAKLETEVREKRLA